MAEKKQDYYVNISNPNTLLKGILQSSKLVVESSQSYYRSLEIRREKTLLFKQLRKEVTELLQLSKKLDSTLPYRELITAEKRKFSKSSSQMKTSKSVKTSKKLTSKEKTTPKQDVEKTKVLSKEENEILKLTNLISSIEEKLNSL